MLVSKLHTLVLDDEIPAETFTGGATSEPRLPRFDLNLVTPPRLEDVVVVGETEGVVGRQEVDAMASIFDGLGVPEVYAARMVVDARRFSEKRVLRDRPVGKPDTHSAHPRDINKAWRGKFTQRSNWWHRNGDTAIKEFQAEANRAAGVEPGGRDLASPDQLARIVEFMNREIRLVCDRQKLDPPQWLEEVD